MTITERETGAACGSWLANMAFLWLLFPSSTPPQPKEQPMQMQFIETALSIQDSGVSTGPPCGHKYVGVGIMYDGVTRMILEAPEHLPAYLAGLRAGDVILVMPHSMTLGKHEYFEVWRHNLRQGYMITPQNICYTQGAA